mmetsp:Transcript_61316/g.159160  ORF Transcript_61316/g.159160 Transcript_61316/m.159160 type:complete len:302 (-) Transcript_61316:15-920(-)
MPSRSKNTSPSSGCGSVAMAPSAPCLRRVAISPVRSVWHWHWACWWYLRSVAIPSRPTSGGSWALGRAAKPCIVVTPAAVSACLCFGPMPATNVKSSLSLRTFFPYSAHRPQVCFGLSDGSGGSPLGSNASWKRKCLPHSSSRYGRTSSSSNSYALPASAASSPSTRPTLPTTASAPLARRDDRSVKAYAPSCSTIEDRLCMANFVSQIVNSTAPSGRSVRKTKSAMPASRMSGLCRGTWKYKSNSPSTSSSSALWAAGACQARPNSLTAWGTNSAMSRTLPPFSRWYHWRKRSSTRLPLS